MTKKPLNTRIALVASALLLTVLAGCSSSQGTSGQNQALSPGDLEAVDPGPSGGDENSNAQAAANDEFLVSDEELRTLATVNYVAGVRVTEVFEEKDLEGFRSFESTLTQVDWSTDHIWISGEKTEFSPPRTGNVQRLMIPEGWEISVGDEVTVAVTTRTKPLPHLEGLVRVVIDKDGLSLGEETSVSDARLSIVITEARGLMGERTVTPEVIVELAIDANAWVDGINNVPIDDIDSRPAPGGLFALMQTTRPKDVVTALDVWLEEDPDWRQLPAGVEELEGLERVLDRDDLAARQAIVFMTGSKEFKYYGVQFDGLGVMGPFAFEADLGIANMSAVIPATGTGELVVWDSDDPTPKNAESLGRFTIPEGWTVDTDFLVLRIDQNKLGEPELVTGREVSEEIIERAERVKEVAVSR